MSEFVTVLRERTKQAGLSQRQLATTLGVTETAVYYWMAGQRTPSTANVVRLESVLGCSRGELLVPLAYSGAAAT